MSLMAPMKANISFQQRTPNNFVLSVRLRYTEYAEGIPWKEPGAEPRR